MPCNQRICAVRVTLLLLVALTASGCMDSPKPKEETTTMNQSFNDGPLRMTAGEGTVLFNDEVVVLPKALGMDRGVVSVEAGYVDLQYDNQVRGDKLRLSNNGSLSIWYGDSNSPVGGQILLDDAPKPNYNDRRIEAHDGRLLVALEESQTPTKLAYTFSTADNNYLSALPGSQFLVDADLQTSLIYVCSGRVSITQFRKEAGKRIVTVDLDEGQAARITANAIERLADTAQIDTLARVEFSKMGVQCD